MGFRSYLSSYETVLTKNKSVNIQRDIISTLTPAVLMSCLDFAFPIPAKTSVDSKPSSLQSFAPLLGTLQNAYIVISKYRTNKASVKAKN